MLLKDRTLCVHMFQMKRSVMLSSSLEFAWGYWISLLAPSHSYVLLVFYYIRKCFVLYPFFHAETFICLDAYDWLTKSKTRITVVPCHDSIQMFLSQMKTLSSLTTSPRCSSVPFPDLPSLFPFVPAALSFFISVLVLSSCDHHPSAFSALTFSCANLSSCLFPGGIWTRI